METLTDFLVKNEPSFGYHACLVEGVNLVGDNRMGAKSLRNDFMDSYGEIRGRYGMKPHYVPLLTPPDANAKLVKGVVPSYGLTLHHYVHRPVTGLELPVVNLCPWAGDCTKVCVVGNGGGRYTTTQNAWRARTDFMMHDPEAFFAMLAYEIETARRKFGRILMRPNVNSDVVWERVVPALVDGSIFGGGVTFYGYSKNPDVLNGNGWTTPFYRVVYSWNEHSDPIAIKEFVARGGSVAVVTNRKPHSEIGQWAAGMGMTVVDADLTDEWMFAPGVLGDLSAKGKARGLIGKSKFVHEAY